MYIDTHAHLTMSEYDDINELLARAKKAEIEAIINASFDMDSSRDSVCLAGDVDFLYAAVGIHPHHAELATEANIAELKHLLSDPKVVAVGETGLDYFKNEQPREVQQSAFRKFLQLAQEVSKPVIIHCRDSQKDCIKIMKEENKVKLTGVFHCFAGDQELIDFAKEIGFYISFTGNVTFAKAHSVRENVGRVPLEMMMIETDCPYLAPEPFRGQRNEPTFVYYVAKAIAELKNIPIEEVAKVTTRNAKTLFRI
jgi:TatD DNase family protein